MPDIQPVITKDKQGKKRSGRPVGSKDSVKRTDMTLEERLMIVKRLCKDTSLTAAERINAVKLYSELQGDKKQGGFESLTIRFEVIADVNVPVDALKQFNNSPTNDSNTLKQDNDRDNEDEPLEARIEEKEKELTSEEKWDRLMGERDKSRDKMRDKFSKGD